MSYDLVDLGGPSNVEARTRNVLTRPRNVLARSPNVLTRPRNVLGRPPYFAPIRPRESASSPISDCVSRIWLLRGRASPRLATPRREAAPRRRPSPWNRSAPRSSLRQRGRHRLTVTRALGAAPLAGSGPTCRSNRPRERSYTLPERAARSL